MFSCQPRSCKVSVGGGGVTVALGDVLLEVFGINGERISGL